MVYLHIKDGSTKNPRYFLAKSFTVCGRDLKVLKFIGRKRPSDPEFKKLIEKYEFELEKMTLEKKAKESTSTYSSKFLSKQDILILERIKHMYHTWTMFLPKSEIKKYEEDFEIRYIRNTTAIEGNTCSLHDANMILNYGILPVGKHKREVYEIENFKKVRRYRNRYKGDLTEEFIKKIHEFTMDNIDYENAGIYRNIMIHILGSDWSPPPPFEIKEDMEQMVNWYCDNKEVTHPLELATQAYHRFEQIHPFSDGNGRVGREIFNFILQKSKFPRFIFSVDGYRGLYLDALDKGDKNNIRGLLQDFKNMYLEQRRGMLRDDVNRLALILKKKKAQRKIEDFSNSDEILELKGS